jgi:hypothetical protein
MVMDKEGRRKKEEGKSMKYEEKAI